MGYLRSGILWRIADRLSGLLAAEERTIVIGDLIESGHSGIRAIAEITGLILRRQVEAWKDWRPWLALFGVSGVAGSFLSVIIFSFGTALIMQLRTYWKYGVHYGDGRTPNEDIVFFSGLFIAICLWAWSSGFVLRLLSRRAVWLTGTFFCLMVLQSFGEYLVLSGHIVSRGPVSFFPPLLGPPRRGHSDSGLPWYPPGEARTSARRVKRDMDLCGCLCPVSDAL